MWTRDCSSPSSPGGPIASTPLTMPKACVHREHVAWALRLCAGVSVVNVNPPLSSHLLTRLMVDLLTPDTRGVQDLSSGGDGKATRSTLLAFHRASTSLATGMVGSQRERS